MLKAFLVSTAALLARSCNDFQTKSADGTYKMSGRTFDHSSSLDARMRGLKAGTTVSLLQVCPTCPKQTLVTKYDMMGMTCVFDYDFGFLDGINSAGLGVGAIDMGYDEVQVGAWNPAGAPTAIPYIMVPAYILAKFATVAEVMATITPSQFQFTFGYEGTQVLKPFPLHISIHDATGKNAVLELQYPGSPPGSPQFSIVMNPLQALANAPGLPTQNEYYQYFVDNAAQLTPEYINPYLTQTYPGQADEAISEYVNIPGDQSSPSRRIRIALFRQLQAQGNWPTLAAYEGGSIPVGVAAWSPNYGKNLWWNTFAMTSNIVLHDVEILGYSNQGMFANPETLMNNPYPPTAFGLDSSIVAVIRDHTTRQYFWWTFRAQRWQSYSLKGMSKSFFSCVTPVPAMTSALYDRTAAWNSGAFTGSKSGTAAGVMISGVGMVSNAVCAKPNCPMTVSGIGIQCRCNAESQEALDSEGCTPSLTVLERVAYWNAHQENGAIPFPAPKLSPTGSLTIQVTSCGTQTAQKCCDSFAKDVSQRKTPLPANAAISCILSNGATLAPAGAQGNGPKDDDKKEDDKTKYKEGEEKTEELNQASSSADVAGASPLLFLLLLLLLVPAVLALGVVLWRRQKTLASIEVELTAPSAEESCHRVPLMDPNPTPLDTELDLVNPRF